jgi:diguanylate cyclase (GGDEF)-like protein
MKSNPPTYDEKIVSKSADGGKCNVLESSGQTGLKLPTKNTSIDAVEKMHRLLLLSRSSTLIGLSKTLPAITSVGCSETTDSAFEQNHTKHVYISTLLTNLLLISTLASVALWLRNRMMSAEIKKRREAQSQLKLANKQILKQAYTDDLTGMGNRRAFYEQAEAAVELAKSEGTPLASLIIDIDKFKNINDRYGHGIGDQVIQKLAEIILQSIRINDVQGRIGGEEFAIITPETDVKGAKELAERIRLEVENFELISDPYSIKATVSIGLTGFKSDADDVNSMMARADKALYAAKDLGRNRVFINR